MFSGMQLLELLHELAAGAKFFFGGDVLFEERNDFSGNGAMPVAGPVAERPVEFVGNIFNV